MESREYQKPASLRGKLQKYFRQPEQVWRDAKLQEGLRKVSDLCGGREVLLYASAYLEKPYDNRFSAITWADKKYLMDTFHGMEAGKDLALIIHTQGGSIGAVQGIVEYMHKMFGDITAIVPLYAMSGGSMICLACDRIVMGKHSQIGPIDPQIIVPGKYGCSARRITNTFKRATEEIMADNGKGFVWSHFLASMAPGLLQEAEDLLKHTDELASEWLQARMFKDDKDAANKAAKIAAFLNAENNNPEMGNIYMHDQGVSIDALKKLHVQVEELESCQELQDAVLTVYHLASLQFERTSAIKLIANHRGARWYINPPPLAQTRR